MHLARASACLPAPQTPLKQRLEEEKREYEAAVAAGPAIPSGQEADLDMRILLVHGDEQAGAGMVPTGTTPHRAGCAVNAAGTCGPSGGRPGLAMHALGALLPMQVADSAEGGLSKACDTYRDWLRKAFPAEQ